MSRYRRPRWLCWVALCASACSTREPEAGAGARAAGSSAVVATIPDVAPAQRAARPAILGLHASIAVVPGAAVVFPERGGGAAVVVDEEDRARVTWKGREGKRYAAVGPVVFSPDGSRFAHAALAGGRWRLVVDGAEGDAFDAVRNPVFSPDGAHVAYQAMDGERWRLVVDRTLSPGTRARYLTHRFSGDSSRLAFVQDADGEGRGRLVVSDLGFTNPVVAGSGVTSFVVDRAGGRIAAVSASGRREQRVLTLAFDMPDRVTSGRTYDAVSGVVLGPDGAVAYVAERSGEHLVVLGEKEEPLPAGAQCGPLVVAPGGASVAALVRGAGGVRLQRFFGAGGGIEVGPYDDAEDLVLSDDGRSHAFAARRGASWFVVVGGKEGPTFDRVVTPVFAPGAAQLAYRARKDGRRFVVVANADGTTRARHAAFDQVFPVRYAPDGRSIGYGAVDGRQVLWTEEAP